MSFASKTFEVGVDVAEAVVAKGAIKDGVLATVKSVGQLLLDDIKCEIPSAGTAVVKDAVNIPAVIQRRPDLFNKPLTELSGKLDLNPAGQAKLEQLSDMFHRATLAFISKAPETNAAFVKRELESDTPVVTLAAGDRLSHLQSLEQRLDTRTLDALKAMEPTADRHILGNIAYITSSKFPAGERLVRRLVEGQEPPASFESFRMSAQLNLEATFGEDSATMKRLLELEKTDGLSLQHAENLNHPQLLEHILASDGAAEKLAVIGARNSPFIKLAGVLGSDLQALDRASSLFVHDGLDARTLVLYVDGQPDRAAILASELKSGATAHSLNDPQMLPSLATLTHRLGADSEALNQARKLGYNKDLNLWNVGDYLDADPAVRTASVKTLLESNSPLEIKSLLRLSMFPHHVAQDLVDRAAYGDLRIAEVVGHARDLESGQNFVELLSRRASETGIIDSDVLNQLAHEAEESPPHASAFVERGSPGDSSTFKSVYEVDADYIEKLKNATDLMLKKFQPDRTLVMLSRDMDAFTPLLRANGRQTINFPFSRLQYRDEGTAAQWLSEVPPNAVVVDSKLQGTILEKIEAFDPTIEPYLLQSRSKFPQLLPDSGYYGLADRVEYFPKLTGRCSGFRPSGAAICRWGDVDKEDVQPPSLMAAGLRQSILQKAGLSDWHVWRYKNFSSVPQSERIGISSPDRIKSYLESVARERATPVRFSGA